MDIPVINKQVANAIKDAEFAAKIKRKSDKYTDLGQVLKDNPLQPFVRRTTMRPVGVYPHGFNFHSIVTPAPAYFFKIGFNPDFQEKYNDLQDNITMVRAKLEYEKLNESKYKPRRSPFGSLDPNINH